MAESNKDFLQNKERAQADVGKRPSTELLHETQYKIIKLDRSFNPPRVVITVKEQHGEAIDQEEFNRFLNTLRQGSQEFGFAKYLPELYDGNVTPDGRVQFAETFIEGVEYKDALFEGDNGAQLNDFVRRIIPFIDKHHYVLDIRSSNLLVTAGTGELKLIDVFPVISKEATTLSANIARDPYAFLLEHLGGTLGARNIHALARRSNMSPRVKEYWAIQAQRVRDVERTNRSTNREFSFEELQALAGEIVTALQELKDVRFAGVFGSMARRAQRVGDIDLFAVVSNGSFLSYVRELREEAFRRQYIRSVFYTSPERAKKALHLTERQKETIAKKRKIHIGDVEKFVKTHLVILPENPDDPEVHPLLEWLTGYQPDARFFANLLRDAQLSVDGSKRLENAVGKEYIKTFTNLAKKEVHRRTQLEDEVWEELAAEGRLPVPQKL